MDDEVEVDVRARLDDFVVVVTVAVSASWDAWSSGDVEEAAAELEMRGGEDDDDDEAAGGSDGDGACDLADRDEENDVDGVAGPALGVPLPLALMMVVSAVSA